MDKGGMGGGQPMWIIIKFYNINMIKEGGRRKTLIHKMWIKRHVLF